MKRNMINQEKLRFPSGIAAAVTLQSLYSQGKEAAAKGKALFWAALAAAVPPLIMDLPFRQPTPARPYKGLVPDTTSLFDWLPVPGRDPKTGAAYQASDWNFVLDNKLVMIAAGALTGPRICFSMVIGGLALIGGLAAATALALRESAVPMDFLAVNDVFGESAHKPEDLQVAERYYLQTGWRDQLAARQPDALVLRCSTPASRRAQGTDPHRIRAFDTRHRSPR